MEEEIIKPKVAKAKKIESPKTIIDPKTGKVIVVKKDNKKKDQKHDLPAKQKETTKGKTTKQVEAEPKVITKKSSKELTIEPAPRKIEKKSAKELTIEPAKREPAVIVRPTPKKVKEYSKAEKVDLKTLKESFTFIANLTTVIEERTMDVKQIPNLTIGELHVIESVNKNNNKPMTVIAKAEKVTVGALTTCVNRLVQKGYLLRTRDEMDHRVILLSVTPLAKKVLKVHDKFHDDIIGILLENVNLGQAAKIMNALKHTLEIYYDPTLIEKEKSTKKRKSNNKK